MKLRSTITLFLLIGIFVSNSGLLHAQILPSSRSTNWKIVGYQGNFPNYSKEVNITKFGGDYTGNIACDSAYQEAVNALNGQEGIIYFPKGTYLFKHSISVPSHTILRGASSDSTLLNFNLGGSDNAIDVIGKRMTDTSLFVQNGNIGDNYLEIAHPELFSVGDYVKIQFVDSLLLFSEWAYGTIGQIERITAIHDNKIYLSNSLRLNYLLSGNPFVVKLEMKTGVGLECFKLLRSDSTAYQTYNINFNYASQSWVSGVESQNCNHAHVLLDECTHITVIGSYFHDSFGYGGNGRGYGVLCQQTTNECKIENNVFKHLRHSMILQSGANANVYGYNYSIEPFWSESSLPSNSSGDMVLHGNYPYLNLFEGNIGQNIVIDNSHGSNGPYNTYFRNRAELYGIFMNSNPASDHQNLIGNEVPNNTKGMYLLNGNDLFQYGNNVRNIISPAGTDSLLEVSYYLNDLPEFLHNYVLPIIGLPHSISPKTNPAKERYLAGTSTFCNHVENSTDQGSNDIAIYPNPSYGWIKIGTNSMFPNNYQLIIYNYWGQKIMEEQVKEGQKIALDSSMGNGLYFIQLSNENTSFKTAIILNK